MAIGDCLLDALGRSLRRMFCNFEKESWSLEDGGQYKVMTVGDGLTVVLVKRGTVRVECLGQ